MFSPKATTLIRQAVLEEQAFQKHKGAFNSLHEAYAVLKEEVEEVTEAQEQLQDAVCALWKDVRKNQDFVQRHIKVVQNDALHLISEAIQVVHVLKKLEAYYRAFEGTAGHS